jgi:putative hydrolase of the HAD superfamily
MKAILFDFGGTIDTNGVHWSEYFWDAYVHAHVPITKQAYEQAYVEAERRLPGSLIQRTDNFSATVKTQVREQMGVLWNAGSHFEPSLADGVARHCILGVKDAVRDVLPLLTRISQRYALGVVSNYYGNLVPSLEELGISPFFRTIIDSAVVGIAKPDPEIFRLALDGMDAQAGETYVVGDSYERDIVPAKQLGCVTIWLCGRSWKRTVSAPKADYVILSLHELSPLLRL